MIIDCYTNFFDRLRILVHGIVTVPCFDTFIMIIIILSSIALAAEDPVQEHSRRNHVLTYFDYVFTGIFAIEMILKVSGQGTLLAILLSSSSQPRIFPNISSVSHTYYVPTGDRSRSHCSPRFLLAWYLESDGCPSCDMCHSFICLWYDVSKERSRGSTHSKHNFGRLIIHCLALASSSTVVASVWSPLDFHLALNLHI